MPVRLILGIMSLALLIFAFMSGVMTPSGYCIGDNILRLLGFKAWSKETAVHSFSGFHNTIFLSIALAIPGYLGTRHYLKNIYPRLVEKLPVIVIILFFTSSLIFNWGYGIFLSFCEGVNGVDYLPAQSYCNYILDPANNEVSYSYQITLKNYTNQTVEFKMQVQKPSVGKLPYDTVIMSDVTTVEPQGQHTIKEFILPPKVKEEFQFTIKDQNDNNTYGNGSMQRPNIKIWHENSIREFKTH